MTDDMMRFLDTLLKRGGGDFMKKLAEAVPQRLMACEVDERISASRDERTDGRITQRNGYREQLSAKWLGTLDVKNPKLRKGSYSPVFSSRDAPPSRRLWPSFKRPGPKGSRPAKLTIGIVNSAAQPCLLGGGQAGVSHR